jgi:hypothetical protein
MLMVSQQNFSSIQVVMLNEVGGLMYSPFRMLIPNHNIPRVDKIFLSTRFIALGKIQKIDIRRKTF